MLSINYPEKYKDESSRIGKKFKYYRVEPVSLEAPKKEKKIEIGEGSGRVSAVLRRQTLNEDDSMKTLKDSLFEESFSDVVDSYLEEVSKDGDNS